MTSKVALVTGASRGIGRAIAKRLGSDGYSVVVNYLNSQEKALQVVDAVKDAGGKAIAIKCDVSKEDEVKSMIDSIIQAHGRLDVVVNNAGIVIDVPFEERTVEHWRRTLDVDLIGVFIVAKYASKYLKETNGRIINISSTNGTNAYDPESIDYSAAKAGVINLTKSLAVQLAPDVMVNCVAPGWVQTEMNKDLPTDYVKDEEDKVLLKRWAQPEEIASVVSFLASKDASYINGTTVVVDGGYR